MKIEFSEKEKNSIGAILFALNNSRWLNDNGQSMTGKEAIKLNGHVSTVLSFFNKMNEVKENDKTLPKAKKRKEKVTKKTKEKVKAEVENANK